VPRFTQPDTIIPDAASPQAFNRYSYVNNNPTTYSDPTGHCVLNAPCPVPQIVKDIVEDAGDAVDTVTDGTVDLVTDVGDFVVEEVAQPVASGAGTVWDRGSTAAVYTWDTARRRSGSDIGRDPVTALFEDVVAYSYILGQDGELKRDGDYCGEVAACITGVTPLGGASATTFGHTIAFEADRPQNSLIAHEIQHVFDIEAVGGPAFYASYFANYSFLRFGGLDDDDAYNGIVWEIRAYEISRNYERGARPLRGLGYYPAERFN
jgi:hypothetical protein